MALRREGQFEQQSSLQPGASECKYYMVSSQSVYTDARFYHLKPHVRYRCDRDRQRGAA
jgi:hypothetical protein